MKQKIVATALLAFCAFFLSPSVEARNSGVEAALANYSDISLFYAAMINTGVMGELNENTRYTIFAPTNEAFAQIESRAYPCFYAVECRARVADVLRQHIVVGRKSFDELTKEADVPTLGHYRVYAESPYVGQYTVANNDILSGADIRGNMIYRIDGVIISNDQLNGFRSMPPLANNTVTEQKTITNYGYYGSPVNFPIPGGGYPAGTTETVVKKTYVVPGDMPSDVIVYPNGEKTTTVTRTINVRP